VKPRAWIALLPPACAALTASPRAPSLFDPPALASARDPSRDPSRDPPLACRADPDCGYAPDLDRCTAEPGANRQPPLVDQGLICFCDDAAHRCAALRVPPVPCESDASCAVRLDPRPHPVAASRAHPHERGRPCEDFVFSTTCERTNICTMRRHSCPRAPRP